MTLRHVALILFLRKRPMTNLMTESSVVVQSKYVIGKHGAGALPLCYPVYVKRGKEICSCSIQIQRECCRVSVIKIFRHQTFIIKGLSQTKIESVMISCCQV